MFFEGLIRVMNRACVRIERQAEKQNYGGLVAWELGDILWEFVGFEAREDIYSIGAGVSKLSFLKKCKLHFFFIFFFF